MDGLQRGNWGYTRPCSVMKPSKGVYKL